MADKDVLDILRSIQADVAELKDTVRWVAAHIEPEPNETTIEAIEAARRGELVTVGTVEGLFADLHADD